VSSMQSAGVATSRWMRISPLRATQDGEDQGGRAAAEAQAEASSAEVEDREVESGAEQEPTAEADGEKTEDAVDAADAEDDTEEEVDPLAELKAEVQSFEDQAKRARQRLATAQDKLQDSGKLGYTRMAAKVDSYKRQMAEKRKDEAGFAQLSVFSDFGELIESLEAAPRDFPATDEGEQKIHDSYQALFKDMMLTMQKQGLEEFHAVLGEKYSEELHHIVHEVQVDDEEKVDTVVEEVARGLRTKRGIVQKSKVAVGAMSPPVDNDGDGDVPEMDGL